MSISGLAVACGIITPLLDIANDKSDIPAYVIADNITSPIEAPQPEQEDVPVTPNIPDEIIVVEPNIEDKPIVVEPEVVVPPVTPSEPIRIYAVHIEDSNLWIIEGIDIECWWEYADVSIFPRPNFGENVYWFPSCAPGQEISLLNLGELLIIIL
jgi:hypothetical protein